MYHSKSFGLVECQSVLAIVRLIKKGPSNDAFLHGNNKIVPVAKISIVGNLALLLALHFPPEID